MTQRDLLLMFEGVSSANRYNPDSILPCWQFVDNTRYPVWMLPTHRTTNCWWSFLFLYRHKKTPGRGTPSLLTSLSAVTLTALDGRRRAFQRTKDPRIPSSYSDLRSITEARSCLVPYSLPFESNFPMVRCYGKCHSVIFWLYF